MAYSTRSSLERRHRLAQQVTQGVRVGARLDVRLHREVAAVGHELAVAQLHPVALHLDHRDALAGMGEHDVELVVAGVADQPDVGHDDPVVAQAVPQRLDDLALLVVGQRRAARSHRVRAAPRRQSASALLGLLAPAPEVVAITTPGETRLAPPFADGP